MCTKSADFKPEAVVVHHQGKDILCAHIQAHVRNILPAAAAKPFSEVTCADIASNAEVSEGLSGWGSICCGSVAQTRCQDGSATGSYGTSGGGSGASPEVIARLHALLGQLSSDTEAVGRLRAKLAEVEAAAAGCNHDVAVASASPMEPLTCGDAASTSEVQFLPVSEMFKPNLEGRLADIKAKGGQMCFCR